MAVELQILPYTSFLGTHEDIHPVVLPEVYSPSGSQNVYVDKLGRAKKISGYTKQTASPITTNTGGSAARIRNLAPFRKTEGGTVVRQVLAVVDDATDEWEIWYSTDSGVTFTFIVDLGGTNINAIADFAQYRDTLFITNGVMAPRKWDGTTMTTAGATQSPTPTAAANPTAGNLEGTYVYKLVSMENDGTRGRGSVTSNVVSVQDKQIDLSWAVDPNVDVTGYEVYRTTGTGNYFYFVAFVEGRLTTTYTDNVEDLDILEQRALTNHGDAPATGTYFCEPHRDRVWWLRTNTDPLRGFFSDLGIADSVGATSYLDFSDAETASDVITGAFGNFDGMLLVFTERSIWTVSGTGVVIGNIVDFFRSKSNAQAGSVSHRTAVKIPSGAIFTDERGTPQKLDKGSVAYFTPYGDIRVFAGDNDTIISSAVSDSLASFNYAARAKCHAFHDVEQGHVIWFYPHSASTEPDRAVVWNYRLGTWHRWFTLPFASACVLDAGSDAQLVLTGSNSPATGGYVYEFWDGNSFDGSNIDARWMTNTIYGSMNTNQADARTTQIPALAFRKRWRWADFLIQTTSGVTMTVEWFPGHTPEGGTATASRTWTPDDTLRQSTQDKVLLKNSTGDYLHDEGLRLRISDNSSNGSWALEAFTLAFQILPGLNRRNQ